MQTIKELSEALKISKVSLYKMVKRPDIAPYVLKKDGTTYVLPEGVVLLRVHYSKDQQETLEDIVNQPVNDGLQVQNDRIGDLLHSQLKEKDQQIKELLNILKNAQQLQAIPLLTAQPEDRKARSLFARLFSKA